MITHIFRRSLVFSHEYADAPWWEPVYRAAFGNLLSCASVRKDSFAQRAGVDRVVVTEHGRTITIDEKVRKEDWPDFALERWSDEARRTVGWIQKPLECEFIAYAFIPTATCYLFPTLTLQRAWRQHKRDWGERYPAVRAFNCQDGRRWTTLSTAVPRDVLLNALGEAMMVQWAVQPPLMQHCNSARGNEAEAAK